MYIKCLLLLHLLLSPEMITIDKIAAVVNDEVITMTDIEKAILFFPVFRNKNESEEEFYDRILEDLINHKVIYLEYHQEYNMTEEDYAQVQIGIIEKVRSMENLISILKQYNMEWEIFKTFIREKALYEKVIKERFPLTINISFGEIEEFYKKVYLPQQELMNLSPRPLLEIAPLIERHLRKQKLEEKMVVWLREIRSSYKIEKKLGVNHESF